MTIHKRAGLAILAALAVTAGGLSLDAQEPASKVDPAAKKKQDPSRRVPPYFGQIGLTTEQRASIYGIQASVTRRSTPWSSRSPPRGRGCSSNARAS